MVSKNERLLDIKPIIADYYLVLMRAYEPSETSRNGIRPWIIKMYTYLMLWNY